MTQFVEKLLLQKRKKCLTRKIACSKLYLALLWKSGLFVRAFFRNPPDGKKQR